MLLRLALALQLVKTAETSWAGSSDRVAQAKLLPGLQCTPLQLFTAQDKSLPLCLRPGLCKYAQVPQARWEAQMNGR